MGTLKNTRRRSFIATLEYGPSNQPIRLPIFSETEIRSESVKWLKRLLLARLGLSSMELLSSEINRFAHNRAVEAKAMCYQIALKASQSSADFMIVLKVVGRDAVGLIPNYRIYNANQIERAFAELQMRLAPDNELWFCLSLIDKKTLSLGGRILLRNTYAPEVAEMVWYTSPRRIEEFNLSNFDYPFLRVVRNPGELLYAVDLLYVPTKYQLDKGNKKYEQEGQWVLRELWSKKDQIKEFCDIIFEAGALEISLEFRVNEGHLAFIDWDTAADLFA